MTALEVDNASLRRATASCVAAIAAIEIPRGEWNELINMVSTTAANDNIALRLSALQTLGYICEECDENWLTQAQKNQIILALINNILEAQEAQKVTLVALKGFYAAVGYASSNFEVAEERDFIMQKVFAACGIPDEEIQEVGLQILVEICKVYYEKIDSYFVPLAQVTGTLARNNQEKVGAQGIEVWTTIAEEEFDRISNGKLVKNYIMREKENLIILLLECIQQVLLDDEDQEDDEWGVALSSGCCLKAVSVVVKDEVVAPVLKFVEMNISS